MIKSSQIDRYADMSAYLMHEMRRKIRDYLREHGESTLAEISRGVDSYEQLVIQHLNKMIEAGIVVKERRRVNGRLISFYSLSEEYNKLFHPPQPKPDILPVQILFLVYTSFTLISAVFGGKIVHLFEWVGIETVQQLIVIGLVGTFTTGSILLYYVLLYFHFNVGEIIEKIKNL